MSADLARARQQLTQVRTLLKNGKYIPAAQALQFGLATALKNQLLKTERDEFEKLFALAVDYLSNDEYIRKRASIKLEYVPGQERVLYDLIKEIVDALSEQVVEEAQEKIRLKEELRRARFAEGIAHLNAGRLPEGQKVLDTLVAENPEDAMLRGSVGEALLKVGLYEPAVGYLTAAIDQKPDMLPLYNSIGIALRRLNRFEVAESYYLRASQYLRHDPNLYFNIGRLYIDWKKWDKAIMAAHTALKLNPDFVEAQKMLDYAEKQKR